MSGEIDSFGRMSCPMCGVRITVVTHIDKAGSHDGVTTIDVDLMPMAQHMAAHVIQERE